VLVTLPEEPWSLRRGLLWTRAMDWVEVNEGGGVIVSSAVAWRLRRGLGIFAVVCGFE
jgi:hypothetical protein